MQKSCGINNYLIVDIVDFLWISNIIRNFDSRDTVDVNFLLWKVPNISKQLKLILKEAIRTSTGNNFISFKIKEIVSIAVTKKYAGIKLSFAAWIKKTKHCSVLMMSLY